MVSAEQIQQKCEEAERVSIQLKDIVDSIVTRICQDLDNYVLEVDNCIKRADSINDIQLEHIVMNLASLLYVVSQARENIGIRQEVSKSIYKEVYNKSRTLAKGTMADKTASAQLASQGEELSYIVFDRAYNAIKVREDAANVLLSAVKKIISRRIAELELSKGVR